jgi:hypothetical protein
VLTILTELPGGEGIVRRDDGGNVVTGDVNDQSGSPIDRLDYRPVTRWLLGRDRFEALLSDGDELRPFAFDLVLSHEP